MLTYFAFNKKCEDLDNLERTGGRTRFQKRMPGEMAQDTGEALTELEN